MSLTGSQHRYADDQKPRRVRKDSLDSEMMYVMNSISSEDRFQVDDPMFMQKALEQIQDGHAVIPSTSNSR